MLYLYLGYNQTYIYDNQHEPLDVTNTRMSKNGDPQKP